MPVFYVKYNKLAFKHTSHFPYHYVVSATCHLVIFLYRLASSQNPQGKEGIETPPEYAPQFVNF